MGGCCSFSGGGYSPPNLLKGPFGGSCEDVACCHLHLPLQLHLLRFECLEVDGFQQDLLEAVDEVVHQLFQWLASV